MTRIEVNINPGILRWAREEAGFDPSEIAGIVNISIDRYKIWDKKGAKYPFRQVENYCETV